MAVIKPFRGVRYNPQLIPDLRTVVSQPYDRISSELQARYESQSPYNIARIIRGHLEDEGVPDSDEKASASVYRRARQYYDTWLSDGVLLREEQPAVYAYEQVFSIGGRCYVRLGMIAAVELSNFAEGIILPHERTHNGPKADRLRLMNTLEVNPEQIFMLYPDSQNQVNALLRSAIGDREPDIDVVETYENSVQQRVWVITNPVVIEAVQDIMRPMRNLIIADGHHRYETALTYRDQMRERYPDAPESAAFNYISATLVSMDDPGLVILPTHREIRSFSAVSPQDVLDRSAQYFTVEPAPDLEACLATVNANPAGLAFGFYSGQQIGFRVLTLKDESLIDRLIPGPQSHAWKSLSVSVAHAILLDQIAEVPRQGVEDKTLIRYHRHAQEAVDHVDSGNGNFVFFLSPTRMDQIRACAAEGEKMPQKSTDFFPKMISGLALLPIGQDEYGELEVLADTITAPLAY